MTALFLNGKGPMNCARYGKNKHHQSLPIGGIMTTRYTEIGAPQYFKGYAGFSFKLDF